MNLSEIYTEVIAEHSRSGKNKREIKNPDFALEGMNPSCGDEIKVEAKLSGEIITDIAFTGSGCAVSLASASIMADLLRGKTLEETEALISLFLKMIKGEITNEALLDELGEAVAFENISNLPARVKCAVLAWHTFLEAIGAQRGEK